MIAMSREKDQIRTIFRYRTREREPVELGHVDVEQHHVDLLDGDQREQLSTARHLARFFDARDFAEQTKHALSCDELVVTHRSAAGTAWDRSGNGKNERQSSGARSTNAEHIAPPRTMPFHVPL